MARSPPPPKWKNRDDIYECEKLLIDNIFSTVKMREDLPQDRRKLIGRRILEAAIATAMNAIEPISDVRHDAKRIALQSDKTAALLSKLLDHLAGRDADNRADAVAHVLRQLIIVDPSRSDRVPNELFSLHEDARRDARTLMSALSALRWIGSCRETEGKTGLPKETRTLELPIKTLLFVCLARGGSYSPANCLTQRKAAREKSTSLTFCKPLGRTRVTRPPVETSSRPLIRHGSCSCRQPLRARR